MKSSASLCLLILLAFSTAWSRDLSFERCPPSTGFLQTIEGSRSLGETELVARNHNIGTYRGGAMKLQPWINVGENAVVGIDESGNVIQALRFVDKHGTQRQVGVKLSSGIKFKTVFMNTQGQLFAFSKTGVLHIFSWEKWKKNEGRAAIERTSRRLTYSVCGLNAAMLVATAVHSYINGDLQLQYLIGGAMGSIGLSMTHLASMARAYEVANEETNGFLPTSVYLNSPVKSTQYQWAASGAGIEDYQITLEDGQIAQLTDGLKRLKKDELVDAPNEGVKAFDVNCDHKLLARGISEDTYESAWRKRK